MRKGLAVILLSLWVLSTACIPQVVGGDPSLDGDISFQPNVIPELSIHFVEEFFRFQWKQNRFDLKLLIHCEGKNLSLRDFWEKTDRLVKWNELITKATDSMYEFGYMIEDIPQVIADNVEWLVWKIEGASFDVDEIEIEEIDSFYELGYNITRFHLPDNLVLSYEDLWLYDFTVSHPNKLETVVKGVKGKIAWNLDPISFSSNIITALAMGTEADPINFWTFWNASRINGWNVTSQTDENATTGIGLQNTQYLFDCRLKLGDGTFANRAYFADNNTQVTFTPTALSADWQYLIRVSHYSTAIFGILEDATERRTSRGISFIDLTNEGGACRIFYAYSLAKIGLYSCSFSSPNGGHYLIYSSTGASGYTKVYNCILVDNLSFRVPAPLTGEIYNTIIQSTGGAFASGTNLNVCDEIYVTDMGQVFTIGGTYTSSMINVYARGLTQIGYVGAGWSGIANLTNVDSDNWNFVFSGVSTGEVYKKYTFDLTFTFNNGSYAEGTNVTISNTYLGTSDSWILTSNGSIPQQTYSMGHYNDTGGNTIYDYNPYNITATFDGYQIYTQLINVTQKEDLIIALQPKTGFTTGFGTGFIIALMIGLIFVLAGIAVKTKKGN